MEPHYHKADCPLFLTDECYEAKEKLLSLIVGKKEKTMDERQEELTAKRKTQSEACPFCGNQDLRFGMLFQESVGYKAEPNTPTKPVTQGVDCPDCKAEWEEVYWLKQVNILREPNPIGEDGKPTPSVRDVMKDRIREAINRVISLTDDEINELVADLADEAFSVAGISDKEQDELWEERDS